MQNKLLDIVKFVGCVFVVAIHQNPFGIYGSETGWLSICACRWAVPFFFASSSYLFWSRKKEYSEYAKRLLLLSLAWIIIYSYFIYTSFSKNGFFDFKSFVSGLLFGNTFDSSWYLTASIEAMGLLWLLRNLSSRFLVLIGVGLYILSLSYSIYYPWLGRIMDMSSLDSMAKIIVPTNSFVSAFIFVVIGKIVAERERQLTKKEIMLYLVFVVLSVMFGIGECVLFMDTSRWIQDALVCLPILTYLLLMLIAKTSVEIPLSDQLCKALRNCSIITSVS